LVEEVAMLVEVEIVDSFDSSAVDRVEKVNKVDTVDKVDWVVKVDVLEMVEYDVVGRCVVVNVVVELLFLNSLL
jgi:hypothetical protein